MNTPSPATPPLILSAAKDPCILPAAPQTHKRILLLLLTVLLTLTAPAHAHVGNKDVYQTITAGPYKLFVTIRTPLVIPGVATIEVRSVGAPLTSLTITPLLLTGEASKHPPTPDAMQQSVSDPAFYTGSLWLMGQGSWQVRFGLDGPGGTTTTSVPVPAFPTVLLTMDRPMGILLAILGTLLVAGIVGIVIAAVGEARLTPGLVPNAARRHRALLAGGLAFVLAIAAVAGGGWWWDVEAAGYADEMHRNSQMLPTLTGDTLSLRLGDPDPKADGGWRAVKNADLLLDHGHPMHLYAIRIPEMDAVFHLHPATVGKAGLEAALPAMPPGTYKLFGDVVFPTGFPETEVATITVPANMAAEPLGTEDASATPPPLSAGQLGPRYKLPDGYTMVFDTPPTLAANTGYTLRFHLLDAAGNPAADMQPYLGMAGHAAFVKTDLSTFAHTHPEGSAAMAAVLLADASTASLTGGAPMDMSAEPLTSTVDFPYGFPSPGRYRIFIQMKHGSTVETGVFDTDVH